VVAQPLFGVQGRQKWEKIVGNWPPGGLYVLVA